MNTKQLDKIDLINDIECAFCGWKGLLSTLQYDARTNQHICPICRHKGKVRINKNCD